MLTKRPPDFHNPVQHAVNTGALPPARECNCFVCGKPAQHYHHVDYAKPLEVMPVCVKCHGATRRKEPGGTRDESRSRDKWLQIPCTLQEHEATRRLAAEYDIPVKVLVRSLLKYAQLYRPRLEIEATSKQDAKGAR